MCLPYLVNAGLVEENKADAENIKKIVSLYRERLKKISEIIGLADFFFKENLDYDKELLKWKDIKEEEVKDVLNKLEDILSEINENNWTKENLENVLLLEAERIGDRGKILWPLRVALTGKEASAGPFEIAEILGKEKTLKRIKTAKNLF
mgnify:CR=1 FL=1